MYYPFITIKSTDDYNFIIKVNFGVGHPLLRKCLISNYIVVHPHISGTRYLFLSKKRFVVIKGNSSTLLLKLSPCSLPFNSVLIIGISLLHDTGGCDKLTSTLCFTLNYLKVSIFYLLNENFVNVL